MQTAGSEKSYGLLEAVGGIDNAPERLVRFIERWNKFSQAGIGSPQALQAWILENEMDVRYSSDPLFCDLLNVFLKTQELPWSTALLVRHASGRRTLDWYLSTFPEELDPWWWVHAVVRTDSVMLGLAKNMPCSINHRMVDAAVTDIAAHPVPEANLQEVFRRVPAEAWSLRVFHWMDRALEAEHNLELATAIAKAAVSEQKDHVRFIHDAVTRSLSKHNAWGMLFCPTYLMRCMPLVFDLMFDGIFKQACKPRRFPQQLVEQWLASVADHGSFSRRLKQWAVEHGYQP